MAKPQLFRMEHQAGMIPRRTFGIKRIAEDRMADLQHVNAQLVAPPSFGVKPDPGLAVAPPDHLPIGDRLAPGLMIDPLAGPVWPIDGKGQINPPFGGLRHPGNARDISFLDLPLLELKAKMALGMGREGKNHHAGRIPVEPVHQKRLGKGRDHARQEAVGQIGPLAGHRKKAAWLIHEKHVVVAVEDREGPPGRCIGWDI